MARPPDRGREMSGPGRILVITTMRNEGPFVLEWIAHHRAIGVTDFLIFSNECDDGTDALLDALAAEGVVTHVRQEPGKRSVQWPALRAAKKHALYQEADWAIAMDCDEFIVLTGALSSLPELIAAAEADAILLQWRLFGSGGALHFEETPVTERFTLAAPPDMAFPAASRFFKTLYRTRAFARPGIHRPKAKAGHRAIWADGSGTVLPGDFAAADERILAPVPRADDLVSLHHYSLRSAEDFLVKRRRGLPNRSQKALDASYWAERNFNVVQDTRASRHWPATRDETEALMARPEVGAAHAAAVAAHQARIRACLANAEEARLFTRLALLTGSVPPGEAVSAALLRILAAADR